MDERRERRRKKNMDVYVKEASRHGRTEERTGLKSKTIH